ncbi:MAG: hypothetical protein WC889_19735 [Myxococcota bacterium]|jgi:hypothetical protein
MRKVRVTSPSFPDAVTGVPLPHGAGGVWRVLCGDGSHWRAGVYSPSFTTGSQIVELERHSCPELFLLISGHVTVVVAEGGALREIALEHEKPVLVTAPHSGFCPDGAHTGAAFVVERDEFETEYRTIKEWLSNGAPDG